MAKQSQYLMQENYHLLVESIKDYSIFMLDKSGHIATWNAGAERSNGYTGKEVTGKHFSLLFPEEDRKKGKPEKELDIALREGRFEEEGWRLRKDGSRFRANIIVTPLYNESMEHLGFAEITRDLTERKEQESLSRANIIRESTNKELDKFASTAGHDLREPLRKISTFCSIILKDNDHSTAEYRKAYLEKILGASKRMDTMIEDILNFLVLSNKHHFERYSLSQVIGEVTEQLKQSIDEKRAEISYAHLPNAIIIPAQMRQLFQNLISNAIGFSKKDGNPRIHISSEYVRNENINTEGMWPSAEYLALKIKDNGTGFEQEIAESGSALAACKKIVANHGGKITANVIPGESAEITIVIPA